jgi:ferredoxin-NADP reductase
MKEVANILSVEKVTHDVLRIITDRPDSVEFSPGQAADVSINKPGWDEEIRPFTFTSLPGDTNLEFTVKTYPKRKGVTGELLNLEKGDSFLIHGVFGSIQYKGEGLFIAGGAGITPFLAIFLDLHTHGRVENNKLLFANKTTRDIIQEQELKSMLGDNFVNILSQEKAEGYLHGYIKKDVIQELLGPEGSPVYVCGPPPMMEAVEGMLQELKVEKEQLVEEE